MKVSELMATRWRSMSAVAHSHFSSQQVPVAAELTKIMSIFYCKNTAYAVCAVTNMQLHQHNKNNVLENRKFRS